MAGKWLIVDDSRSAVEALASLLDRMGYSPVAVHCGKEALSKVDETFDGAIIDLNLPDISGNEIIKAIKKKFPKLKLGLISGQYEPETLRKIAESAGADFWIRKPVEMRSLLEKINENKKGGGKMLRRIGIIAAILAGILIVAFATQQSSQKSVTIQSKIPEISRLFADVAEKAMKSVVTITSAKVYEIPVRSWEPFRDDPLFNFFFGPRWKPKYWTKKFKQEGLGSGVIVTEDGYILTNAHVVKGADEIQVHIGDKQYDAKIVGIDEKTDVAVLKVDADEKLPAAKLGDSDKIRVGEWVLAIGSPFRLEHTVTAGIISAKGRSRMGIADYEDFIQTDAAINPGNSGGALVNLNGEVIGINTAIVSQAGGNIGIGFAIPINLARRVMDQLIAHGRVIRGWLGVTIQDMTDNLAEAMGLKEAKGVLITSVLPGSPAEDAGLKRGDIILKVDGKDVESVSHLRNIISSAEPGTKVKLTIFRDGQEKILTVKLGEMPSEGEVYSSREEEEEGIKLGLSVRGLTYKDRKLSGYDGEGVIVEDVEPNSVADAAGIKEGDIIIEINNKKIESPADVRAAARKLRKGKPVVFVVWRDGYIVYLAAKAK